MCEMCLRLNLKGFDHAANAALQGAAKPATDWSLDQIVDQLNRGDSHWNNASPITFSFATSRPGYSVGETEYGGFHSFNEQQKDAARLALSTWSDVANLTFWEVTTGTGKISFANSSTLASYSAAHSFYPSTGQWGGDVWVNSDYSYNTAPTVGNYGFQVLVHELGHSIGQMHPGDYNADGGKLSYAAQAAYAQDSRQYSIMSYWDESNTGADFGTAYPETPMLHDILAIQEKYGVNWNTRIEDTVYGFNSNTQSPIYDFSQNHKPVLCIWDGAGNDTLDLSGFQVASTVDLNPGSFSSTAGMTYNISIAYGALIENCVTGVGDDSITGNFLNNRVDGGAGRDIFNVSDFLSASETFVLTNGNLVVHSSQGTDELINIESLIFSDATIDVSELLPRSILEYAASYQDLINAFGTNEDLLQEHLLSSGLDEGRSFLFSALEYIASNDDLILAFGTDVEAGARHYIEYGMAEGRATHFDGSSYLAAHPAFAAGEPSTTSVAEQYIEAKLSAYDWALV